MIKYLKSRSNVCKFGFFYIFNHGYFGRSKFNFFSSDEGGKVKILRGYCGGKGSNLYIRPWALFADVDMFDED